MDDAGQRIWEGKGNGNLYGWQMCSKRTHTSHTVIYRVVEYVRQFIAFIATMIQVYFDRSCFQLHPFHSVPPSLDPILHFHCSVSILHYCCVFQSIKRVEQYELSKTKMWAKNETNQTQTKLETSSGRIRAVRFVRFCDSYLGGLCTDSSTFACNGLETRFDASYGTS